MALTFKNRVREKTTKTGTGTAYQCGTNVNGFQPFSVLGNNAKTIVRVEDTGTNWEVIIATYTSANDRLTRNVLLSSSNNNAPVNWSAGTKDMAIVPVAERQVTGAGAVTVTDNENTGQQVVSVDAESLIDAVGLEDGYAIKINVFENELGTHTQPERIVTRSTDNYANDIEIDLAASNGEWHRMVLTGNPTLTVVNFEHNDPAEPGKKFVLEVVQDATGGRTIDFAGSAQTWTFNDGEPSLSALPNSVDLLEFLVIDIETPEFLFIKASHRPRRHDDLTEPASSAAIATTRESEPPLKNNAIYLIPFLHVTAENGIILWQRTGPPTGGTFDFVGNMLGEATQNLPYNITFGDLFDLISENFPDNDDGKPMLAIGNSYGRESVSVFDANWMPVGKLSGFDLTDIFAVDSTNLVGGSYSVTFDGGESPTSSASITGSYTLSVDGQISAPINATDTASQITAKLEALSTVGIGNVQVTMHYGINPQNANGGEGLIEVEFVGDLAGTAVSLTLNSQSLNNCMIQPILEIYDGGGGFAGQNEQQTLTITGTPTKGTLSLEIFHGDPEEIAVELPHDASAATAENLINAAVGEIVVDVTGGPLPGSALVIEYVGTYSATDVPEAIVDDTGINGHAALNWLKEINYITLSAGTYTPIIDGGLILPSQTIRVAVETDGVIGTPDFDGVDFGDEGSPTLPGNGKFDLFELTAVSASKVIGRTLQTGLIS